MLVDSTVNCRVRALFGVSIEASITKTDCQIITISTCLSFNFTSHLLSSRNCPCGFLLDLPRNPAAPRNTQAIVISSLLERG